jgi:hypothetical protein
VEKTCKRIGSMLYRLTEETQRNISLKQVTSPIHHQYIYFIFTLLIIKVLMVGNTSAEDFVTEFSWDLVKYPYLKQNCKDIAATIIKVCQKFVNELILLFFLCFPTPLTDFVQ